MRHALARGVENALTRRRVFRESREDHTLDDREVRALVPVVIPAFPISLRRS